MISRRSFLTGLGAALAAPAVIRIPGLLMPIKALVTDPIDVSMYLTEESAWAMDLNEAALENLIIAINATRQPFVTRPIPPGWSAGL